MDKKMIEMLDSAQTISTLSLMIAMKANEKEEAKEIALRYMENAMKELWNCRQALRAIVQMQDYHKSLCDTQH